YISASFPEPVTLQPGVYFASIEIYSNENENRITVRDDQTVPQPLWSSLVYLPFASGGSTPNRIWSNGNAFGIRLRLNTDVSIEEQTLAHGVRIMPNPASDVAHLSYQLPNAADAMIDLVDMSGKLVMTHVAGKRAAGEHRHQINTADLEAGMYMNILTTAGGKVTGRLSVVK